MGFAPEQVDRMSLWQFAACVAAWNRANSPEPPGAGPMSDREFAAAAALIEN